MARIGARAPRGLGFGIDPAPDGAPAGLPEHKGWRGHHDGQGERETADETGARAGHCVAGSVNAMYSPL